MVTKIFSRYKNQPKIVSEDLRIFNILCRLVNNEPLNTLELLFPISKKKFVLVLSQFPKMIIYFLLRSKIHHSCLKLFPSYLQNVLFRNESFVYCVGASLCCVCIHMLPSDHCGRNTHFRQIYFAVPNFNFIYIYIKLKKLCDVARIF